MDNLFPSNFHIGVDGLDGVGKTTFVEALTEKIELECSSLGLKPNIGHFSNIKQTQFGDIYRKAATLMEDKEAATVMKALLDYVVERNLSMSCKGQPMLSICDRTILSTLVYQKMTNNTYFSTLVDNGHIPDLFFVVHVGNFQTWSERVSNGRISFPTNARCRH